MEKQIAFRVSDDQLKKIDLSARERGMTVAGFVRFVMYQWLAESQAAKEN